MSAGKIVWFTGLPSSGKSGLARATRALLGERAIESVILDGDDLRKALVPPPGYDERERADFYATLANLAGVLAAQGLIVLVAATAHRKEYRERARALAREFFEVWVDVPLEECRRRDSKGLYKAFAEGRVRSIPGEDVAYEPPSRPDVIAHGGKDVAAATRVAELVGSSGPERGSP